MDSSEFDQTLLKLAQQFDAMDEKLTKATDSLPPLNLPQAIVARQEPVAIKPSQNTRVHSSLEKARRLDKPAADALRLAVALLAKANDYPPSKIERIAFIVDNCIEREGRWIDKWMIDEIPPVFFPDDPQRAANLRKAMDDAIAAGKLVTHGTDAVTATGMSLWPDCPKVPRHSPFVHWLPAWMHETDNPDERPPVFTDSGENLTAPTVEIVSRMKTQRDEKTDDLRIELDPLLEEMSANGDRITAGTVMPKLKARAGKNASCITESFDAGILWMRGSTGTPEKLTMRMLQKRIDRWRGKQPR